MKLLILTTFVFFNASAKLLCQIQNDSKNIIPEGITLEYGIGSYAVTDD